MSNPATITDGSANTFTATNTTLSATTTYWLVTRSSHSTTGAGFDVYTTTNTTADSGAAMGWSIGNGRYKSARQDLNWGASSNRIIFTIRGTLGTGTPTNAAPTVATAILDQTATTGAAFNFAFPSDHVHRCGRRRHADLRGDARRRHGAARVAELRRRHAHLLGHANGRGDTLGER